MGLGRVRDADSIALLLAVLSNKDENSGLMAAAAEALGQIGDPSAVGGLVEALHEPRLDFLEEGDDPKRAMHKHVAEVRGAAARALAEIGTPEALAALEKASTGGAFGERTAAREALGLPSQP
jgi:HEAT repeat protein